MKTKPITGFRWMKSGKEFDEIKKVFRHMWCYYDFYREEAQDLPYWSTEMALVGNMAIASAWAGFPAALEFLQDKPGLKSRKRADLWMGFPKNRSMLVEAKCRWFYKLSDIDIRTTGVEVNKSLREADKQLYEFLKGVTKDEQPTHLMSILFLQVCINKKEIGKGLCSKIEKIYRSCKVNGQIPFTAYYFLENTKEFKELYDRYDKKFSYPGVIIFGRISGRHH